MQENKDIDEIVPKLDKTSSPIPKINENIAEIRIAPQHKVLKKRKQAVTQRKALKKRETKIASVDPIEEIIFENTIELPKTSFVEETVELPILLSEPSEPLITEQIILHNTSAKPEPTIEETVELPLFRNYAEKNTPKQVEDGHIVVENKTFKKKRSILKKCLGYISFVMVLLLTVFCTYKVVLWHKENKIIDQEMNRIQNLIEERVVEPTLTPTENRRENEDGEPTDYEPPEEPTDAEGTSNGYFDEYINQKSENEEEDGITFIDVDISKLKTINSDTNAYLKINNLDVNYPVVQTTDNSYYLSHSFDKKYTSAGWIFGDYRNDWDNLNDNTIIYGHNRRNYAMFGSLKKIYEKVWYENRDNHMIYLSTENKNMIFQIFSVYDIPTETYYLTNNFKSKQEHQTFLETITNRSTIKFDIKPSTDDKILTLSTCSGSKNKTVVHAKLIKMQDKKF